MVGLLLPPSVGGALANWAALFCGKVPVNLNYTLSEESLASCAKQCELKTILTSRAFIEKVKPSFPGEVFSRRRDANIAFVWREAHRVFIAAACPSPPGWNVLNPQSAIGHRQSLDSLPPSSSPAAAHGEPKGVMLSHYNVGSNLGQLGQTFAFGGTTKCLGFCRSSTSFGFTGTLRCRHRARHRRGLSRQPTLTQNHQDTRTQRS